MALDEWSDSDDEVLSDVETSVLLGVPDGPLETIADINDAAVSRIGGHPAFLPSREPPFSSSHCKICSNTCELIVQMWCPFEDSPMDRAMYIWGCPRASCQGKDGSIRAWRGLRFNEKYAAKLKAKLVKKQAASQAEKVNPFSMRITSSQNTNIFGLGLGDQIFGEIAPTPTQAVGHDDNDSNSESESDKSLLTAMASATVTDSQWKLAPSYPPLYLSTVSEYLPPQPKHTLHGPHVTDPAESGEKGSKDISWASEAYEDSLEMDHVFERFTKRVGYEGEQCVRYELDGTPLPFSSDQIFDSLFPSPPAPTLPVTKPAFTVVHTPKRTYAPLLTPCPSCKGKRVFECQLMPNLINVLRLHGGVETGKLTDEKRRKVLEKALKGQETDGDGARGLDWGTCMVFSCEKDCCIDLDGKEAKECWREELVLIQ
ncbi:hypothetical protein L208DRAFT_1445452, partial [Tricholoma matsutake]